MRTITPLCCSLIRRRQRGNQKAPQPSGSFDRSIEKAQKAIQLHSIKKRPKRKGGREQCGAEGVDEA